MTKALAYREGGLARQDERSRGNGPPITPSYPYETKHVNQFLTQKSEIHLVMTKKLGE